MKFSVVIPALNEVDNITRAIHSARQAGAHEVVVSDGGSTDGTPELAVENEALVVQSEPGRGIQLNTGARVASGDVLVFLHGDNQLATSCGTQIREAFESGVQFCCFRQRIENDRRIFRWIESGNAMRARVQGLPYGDQGLTVSRELFNRVNGFESIPLMEDVAFSRKVSRLAPPHLLPGPIFVSDRRWRKNGVVRQTIQNWLTMLRYRLGASPDQLAANYYRTNHQIAELLSEKEIIRDKTGKEKTAA